MWQVPGVKSLIPSMEPIPGPCLVGYIELLYSTSCEEKQLLSRMQK